MLSSQRSAVSILTGSRARAVESLEGLDLVETVELADGGRYSGYQKIQGSSANTRWTRGVALDGVKGGGQKVGGGSGEKLGPNGHPACSSWVSALKPPLLPRSPLRFAVLTPECTVFLIMRLVFCMHVL